MSFRPAIRTYARTFRSSTTSLRSYHGRAISLSKRPNSYSAFSKRLHTPVFSLISRSFHGSGSVQALMPDSSDPPMREAEDHDHGAKPSDMSIEEYHTLADAFFEDLLAKLEKRQEEAADIDVEYAAGVLSIEVLNKGVYILNKQPANKQIWLSSPTSGPKRYDWVMSGESMHGKEGAGIGEWLYLRDKSSLNSLLRKEIGIDHGLDDIAVE